MANTNLNVRMKHVVKTEAEWNATTSKPLKGEICITDPSGRIKVGDGTNLWSALPYIDASNITALSNSGSTITYTKADGTTGTITLPSYSVATSSTPGLVKSGTDISVDSSGNVSVVDNSHNHTIANVTNLQTNLDAKAPKASPALTGTPTAPTATAGTNTTQIATTAFVKTAVDNATGNVEVGGRNYVKNSKFTSTSISLYGAESCSCSVVSDSTYGNCLKAIFTAAGRFYYSTTNVWQSGQKYAVSFLVKADGDGVTIRPSRSVADYGETMNVTSSWSKYTGIIDCTVDNNGGTLSFSVNKACTVYVTYIKLEKGNKCTDWTPAPEDLVSSLSLSGSTLSYSDPLGTQKGTITLSKSTVGLGNVDNTSDANKPISTATQIALNNKVDKTNILTSGTDLNTVTTSGFYKLTTNHSNAPTGTGYTHGQMLVIHGGSDTIAQLIFSYSTSSVYLRTGNPASLGNSYGTWKDWVRLIDKTYGDTLYSPIAGSTSLNKLASTITLGEGSGATIDQNSDTYRQRFEIIDNSTANDAVFKFSQSTNSGSSYTNLMEIRDDGNVVATTFTGSLSGNASSATYTSKLKLSSSLNSSSDIDAFVENEYIKWAKVPATADYQIGWGSKDGMIISIPWSNTYCSQIAIDEQSNWIAIRALNNTAGWTNWDRILTTAYGNTLYLPLTGGSITGNLSLKTTYNLSAADNGVSSTQYPTTFCIFDASDRMMARLEGVVKADGTMGSYWYIQNYNTDGELMGQKGIQMSMDKSGNLTYTISDILKFRMAINAPAMSTASSESYPALLPTSGTNNWIKVGTNGSVYGLIPSQGGNIGSGHNYLGTSSWYWYASYVDNIFGNSIWVGNTATGDYDVVKILNNCIDFKNANATISMVRFLGGPDAYGHTISIGGGGGTIIGGGESATACQSLLANNGDERMIIANDGIIEFYDNCQNGTGSAHKTSIESGSLYVGSNASTDTIMHQVVARNAAANAAVHAAASGNHGLYSGTKSGWIIYCTNGSSDSIAYIPRQLNVSGSVIATVSSGEADVVASNGTNKIYLFSNSNGAVGLYHVRADSNSNYILRRNNNTNDITTYGNWHFPSTTYCETSLYLINTGLTKGTTPSAETNKPLWFVDKNGSGMSVIYGGGVNTAATAYTILRQYKFADNNYAQLGLYYPASGSAYIETNCTFSAAYGLIAANSSGEAYVMARASVSGNRIYMWSNSNGTVGIYSVDSTNTGRDILRRANNSSAITAYGGWYFGSWDTHDSGIIIRNTGLTKGTNPSSEQNRTIVFTDKDGYNSYLNDCISMWYGGGVTTSGTTYSIIRTYKYSTSDGSYASLLVGYNTSAYVETNCDLLVGGNVSSNVGSATTRWVRSKNSTGATYLYTGSNGDRGIYVDSGGTAGWLIYRPNGGAGVTIPCILTVTGGVGAYAANSSSVSYFGAYGTGDNANNQIYIQAETDGQVTLGSRGRNSTWYTILKRANNSENVTIYGTWYFNNSIWVGASGNTYNQYVHVRNSSQTIALHAATSGNAGVYSETKSKWLIYINSSGTVTANTSDIRYKNVIDNMSDKEALDILRGINIINFTYKDDENKIVQNGVIAQQLRDILINNKYGYRPYLSIQSTQTSKTYYDLNMPEDNIQYGIDYGRMVPTLWKGWQILDNTITTHEDRLTKLENENKQLKKKITMLENQLKGA